MKTYRPLTLARIAAMLSVIAMATSNLAFAQQENSSSSAQMPRAQQVAPSGRMQGSNNVQAQQSAGGAGTSSVNTVNSTIQVSGSYQGSIPDPDAPSGPNTLTIADAVQRGLRFNLGNISADVSVRQQRALRLAALSQLLPEIYATVSETGAKIDLESMGISQGTLGLQPVPTTVGPFHYYSALGNVSEEFSLASLHNLRQSEASARAVEMNARDARELVILAVSGSYLRVLAAKANVISEEAQVKQAQATFQQSDDQYRAGTKPVIDLNRTFVQYQTEQQRLVSFRADLVKQTMQLARLIGLPTGQELVLSEDLPAKVPDPVPLDDALRTAIDTRADLQASRLQLQPAQEAHKASKSEYLPSIEVKGDYGLQGVNPNSGASVFQASATLRIPIFESGRIRADVHQADAAVTQRQAEYADQRGAVELEVRQAYVDLRVATAQIATATENRSVARETLQQSIDRFNAGVTNSVEVVQSEETVASAERDYVNSLFTLNLGRINLARATGQAERFIPNMLKGN